MTTVEELSLASLEDISQQIAKKEASPVELTETMLARIERLNPSLNAYITVTAEQAIADAREAEREIVAGRQRGPLHGVPVALKDLFATKGVRTTAGSKILSEWVPDYDATVVANLREAGAVSLGKLGMHEFAYGATSINDHYGDIHNPWDLAHSPGGSSGGSGAATAAGLAYATLGSDTGGSVRIPAALCGCVGMMPTYGRASLYGAIPLSWTLDHAGPLTRTVRDATIVLQGISGLDPRDPSTVDVPVPDWLDGIERGPKGLRVGVPKQHFWDSLDAEVERLVRKAIDDLASAGAQVREVDWPAAADYARYAGTIIVAEAAAYHAPNYPSRRDDYSAQVAGMLEVGTKIPAIAYVEAMRALQDARRGAAGAALEGVDVLAVPTTPEPAPTIASVRVDDQVMRRTAFTALFDLTGQPAISVPCGITAGNLPVGLMFAGRHWDEASVLWAGRAYEQMRGPFPAPPLS